MKTIVKDITTVEKGVIVHQVNCKSAMGSGVALAIKNKWPIVYENFMIHSKNVKPDWQLLGDVQYVTVGEDLVVINIFTQYDYGTGKGQKHTEYAAWREALRTIADSKWVDHITEYQGHGLYFPYKCGCDRGGGNWDIVSEMIDMYLPNATICKLYEEL